jgi:hypothetical protein
MRDIIEILATEELDNIDPDELSVMLLEDMAVDKLSCDLIREIINDRRHNRKADEILENLASGRRHMPRSEDIEMEEEVQTFTLS